MNSRWRMHILRTVLLLAAVVSPSVFLAQSNPSSLRTYVPDTVSPGWRSVFESFRDPATAPAMPGPTDIEAWDKVRDAREKILLPVAEQAVRRFEVAVVGKDLGGVPVLEITPKNWQRDRRVLVYTHGGGYTTLSAR